MLVHAELAYELSAAHVTRVGKVLAVRWHVLAQIGHLGEGGRTLCAMDWSGRKIIMEQQ